MTKAIIFDLDSCLAAANEVGDELFSTAFAAIRTANRGTVAESALREALDECWRCAFDFVAARYQFSEAMRSAGWQAFRQTEVTKPMYGYGDLNALKDLPEQLFLVTSGIRRLQESKIKALRFDDLFAAIYIDAIDEPERKGKYRIFKELLAKYGLHPDEVLVVGDNPDSEIEAGNRLGMKTIQILRPGVMRSAEAKAHIHSLHELKAFL
ncbi:MAG: HAD family hydrolase [Limisphaerales bacterium]